ncbi:hypothetical protein SAMN05428969_0034 [Devosia sp. YR412]|uniref:hypothetical protein n=1 Tax=Devosia sp. YR412 TaxID=1881030 RepID=UPI0008B29772|nr:hypothetical protein [Devosia sp. YR412]SEP59468.1 hypothetical protein SAMN05428969_0034 [Devosia sp. YR412]
MAWELLAIWLIVTGAVIWFIRDERRRRSEAHVARAARYYAHAPKYRHVPAELRNAPLPPQPTGGLTEAQRAFFKAFRNSQPS